MTDEVEEEVEAEIGFSRDNGLNFCELPAVRRKRRRLNIPETQEDDEGDHWICPICPLSDLNTRAESLPPCIDEFRRALIEQARLLPNLESCQVIASMFNDTCYRADRRSPHPVGIRRLAANDIYRHFQHTRHLPNNEEALLSERIWYILKMMEQVEKNQLWYKTDDHKILMLASSFRDWKYMLEILKKFIEMRYRFSRPQPESNTKRIKFSPRYDIHN